MVSAEVMIPLEMIHLMLAALLRRDDHETASSRSWLGGSVADCDFFC